MSVFKDFVVTSSILFCLVSGSAFAAKHNAVEQPMTPPSKASLLFYTAAKNKNYEMMDTYLARGADINCGNCDPSALPPLARAVTEDMTFDPELPVYLVKHGANVNLLTQGRMSPLMFALNTGWSTPWDKPRDALLKNLPLLVENGADVNLVNSSGYNALFFLVAKGYDEYSVKASMQLMRYLVDKGTDVNHQSNDGKTALMLAASGCGVKSVQHLLFLHANPNLNSAIGETALSLAEDSAVKSRSGSNCNQVVAMLRNPSQFAIDPLSSTDVIVTAQPVRSAGVATAATGAASSAINAFAGNYVGNYSGDDQGSFQVVISQEGNITLSGKSFRSNQAFTGDGKINSDGSLGVSLGSISSGATFQGSINPATGALYGTWKNSGQAGIFSGNKQAQLDNPLNAIGGLLNGLGKILGH